MVLYGKHLSSIVISAFKLHLMLIISSFASLIYVKSVQHRPLTISTAVA